MLRVVLGDVKAEFKKKTVVLCEDTLVSGAVAWNNLVGLRMDAFPCLDAFVVLASSGRARGGWENRPPAWPKFRSANRCSSGG